MKKLLAALGVVSLLAVAACDSDPAGPGTPTVVPTVAPTTAPPTPTPTAAPTTPAAERIVLSGTAPGRLKIGGSSLEEATAVFAPLLGEPTVTPGSCEAAGENWKRLGWPGFALEFNDSAQSKVLRSWSLRVGDTPSAQLQLSDGLPDVISVDKFKATFPEAQVTDAFGTGGGPWIAQPVAGITYVWLAQDSAVQFEIVGGSLSTCE